MAVFILTHCSGHVSVAQSSLQLSRKNGLSLICYTWLSLPTVTPSFSSRKMCSIPSLADNPILFFLSLWGHNLKFHYYLFHGMWRRRGEWVIYASLFIFHSKAIRWLRSRMFCKPVLQPHSCAPYHPFVQSPELGSATWTLPWLILFGLFSGSFSLSFFLKF